jgi:hypothetical protein
MKTILLIGMMFWGLIGMGGNNTVNLSEYSINEFVSLCTTELGIDSANVVIKPYPKLIFDKYYALTYKENGKYIMLISTVMTESESLEIIAHELCHVKQMYSGTLIVLENGNIIFENKKYSTNSDSHYDDPQEIQARKIGYNIYKKYRNGENN